MAGERDWRRQLRDIARDLAPPENKGEIYAAHFSNFLRGLMDRGPITDWLETQKNSPDDQRGIDFLGCS